LTTHVDTVSRFEWPARAFFGLLLAGSALAAVYAGGVIFASLVAVLAFACAREWHRLVGGARYALPAIATCVSTCAALAWVLTGSAPMWSICFLAVGSVVAAVLARTGGASALWNGVGVLYLGLPALSLVALRVLAAHGMAVVLIIFFTVWITDTGALAGGRFIGGPKLIPRLSPNKTWAGFLAGTVLSVSVVTLVLALRGARVWEAVLLVLALAVSGHGGDLFESWVKRRMGCKDSGGLIPGHGGVLDRLDSTLFAAPLAAALVFVFGLDPLCGGHP
jgi:phosphatidate cytidylyltransferase